VSCPSTHDVDEAIVLADRVLVLAQGRISVDRPVELPMPRRRGDPGFLALRGQLLDALGVDETAVGSPAAGRPPRR
jgi:sulfonate transport system ATP-binding protein